MDIHSAEQGGESYNSSTYGHTGIDIQCDFTSPDPLNLIVQDNYIDNYEIGIHVRNFYNDYTWINSVSGNTIKLGVPLAHLSGFIPYGIWSEDNIHLDISTNDISWFETPSSTELDLVRGIAISSSTDATVQENKVTQLGSGIKTKEDCSNINFYCNNMNTCYVGFYADNNGILNVLTKQGTWTTDPSTSESWNNEWVSNISTNKVGGSHGGANFIWTYDPSAGPDFTPSGASWFIAQPCSTTTNLCNPPARVINPVSPTIVHSFANGRFGNGQLGHEIHIASASSDQVIDSGLIEANYQFVNWVHETFYAIDSLPDSLTIVSLTDIAYQHAGFGGKAVYIARAMLNLDIEDRLTPARKYNENHTNNNKLSASSYIFYPNPSSNKVTLQSQTNFNKNSNLILHDALNRVVKEIKLLETTNSCEFDVRDLPSGIYTGEVTGQDDKKLKLVITKE